MRVLFFHPLTGHLWRGIERNVVVLASAMAEHGHDSAILTLNHPEQALLPELHPEVQLFRAPYSRYYSYQLGVPFFTAHLIRHRYDAVVVFFGGFGVGPSLAAARRVRALRYFLYLGYPVEVAPHRYDEFVRWSLPSTAAGIWAHGEHVAVQAQDRFDRPVASLPTGVDIRRFTADSQARSQVRESLGIAPDTPVVLTVSALDHRKGIQHVLEALPRVRASVPGVKYVIAGDGDHAGELRRQVDNLGLHDAVILLGAYSDVERLYAAADVFCLLARGEAGPIVLYEALATGLPVMTLAAPHLTEHFGPDDMTFVSTTSVPEVSDNLVRLLTDRERREAMAQSGRRIIAETYSVDRLCLDIEGLINKAGVISRTAPPMAAGRL